MIGAMTSPPTHRADLLVPVAMVLPTLSAALYFILLDGEPAARWAYLGSKLLQLAIPLVWWLVASRETGYRLRLGPADGRSLVLALGTGGALALAVAVVYRLTADAPLWTNAVDGMSGKLADFGILSPLSYLGMTLALALANSLFEEIYWRWLVYGRLAARMAEPLALVLASLSFAAHHWIVVSRFLEPGALWTVGLPATLAVAFAGAVWCRLLRATGGLLAPWLSHVLADLALMAIGYLLLF